MNLIRYSFLFLFLCVATFQCFAQDERFYRSIFNGEILKEKTSIFPFKIGVKSPKYMIDLNRDGQEDTIQTVKRDGIDFIRIADPFGKTVLFTKLDTLGDKSKIYKAQYRAISKNVDVVLIHYYEGHTQSSSFEGSARLYIITIVDRDMSQINIIKGPHIWHELEREPDIYWNRRYSVNTVDYNKDGVREISISYNKIQTIYKYKVGGIWSKI